MHLETIGNPSAAARGRPSFAVGTRPARAQMADSSGAQQLGSCLKILERFSV